MPSTSESVDQADLFGSVLDSLGCQMSTPALIVLIDVVADSIARTQAFADEHGKELGPHGKTHKSVRIGRMQLEAGAAGLTAGDLSEAEIFAGIDRLAEAVGEFGSSLGIVIEVDCGARRSGAPAGADQAEAFAHAVYSLDNHGIEPRVVRPESTPTAVFSTDSVITEIRPGEYIFNDDDNLLIGDCAASDIGLFVASTVVSDQGHEHVNVDAGTKALSREGDVKRGFGRAPSCDGRLSALNDYHGFLQLPDNGPRPVVGQSVAIVPHYVCPIVDSFDELIIANSDGELFDRWSVDAQGQLN